ncbi:MAG: hypothetical protein KDC71_21960, partial [Acidobacteria bacterium]|nr:hypothetical protein [Acidobacteriota bacterium]
MLHRLTFMRYRHIWGMISGVSVLVSIGFLSIFGVPKDAEFQGGVVIEILSPVRPIQAEELRIYLTVIDAQTKVQTMETAQGPGFQIKMRTIDNPEAFPLHMSRVSQLLNEKFQESPRILSADIYSPSIAADLISRAWWAGICANLGILVYLGLRFQWGYAV